MICPNCGKQIPDGSKFCPYCGAKIEVKGTPELRKITINRRLIVIPIVVLLVIAGIFAFTKLFPSRPLFGPSGVSGKYICIKGGSGQSFYTGDIVEFKPNGEVYLSSEGQPSVVAKYEVDGENVTIRIDVMGSQYVLKGTIKGNTIVFDDGAALNRYTEGNINSTTEHPQKETIAGPIWPMFRYNTQHTGQCPYDTSRNNGTLKWKFAIGDQIHSSPAIASDGTIYIGSDDRYLYAINPNGTLKWKFKTGNGIYSSPAIASDGTIYIGSWDHYLYAINPDGTLKWKFKTGNGIYSSPAIASDGTIYIGSWDHYLYAINPDRTLKWEFETGDGIYSSPAIASDGTIYIGSDDQYLYAIGGE